MRRSLPATLALPAALFILGAFAPAQVLTRATNSAAPLSDRVVAYKIDAKLDTDKKTLDATESLSYKNETGQPLTVFPFHLYMNAFRPESTFSTEARSGGIRDGAPDWKDASKAGSIVISQMSADGMGDVTGAMQFTAPDDGNMADHTVMQVTLPHAIAPGETVTFHMTFKDKFPESIARNGYKRDFIMGGQWFPKVGVFWKGAFNCHQYHASTEFFSDFGTYDVTLNVPKRYIVGASGIQIGEQAQSDNTKTLTFHGEDIIDFAWAASPRFLVADTTYQSTMGPVKLHALVLQVHDGQQQRYLDVLKQTMQKFDDWYGPYPYTQITLIDPEPDSAMEGMEYPTLITGGTSNGIPPWIYSTELVTEHEFGHQYWYAMVATNEFEEAWLDEGINSYTEARIMGSIYGRDSSILNGSTIQLSDKEAHRLEYLGDATHDPISRFAWQFETNSSYGAITYGKTSTVLSTLEYIVGPELMTKAMHTYFMRYRFKHPTGTDFIDTIKEVTGRTDLDSFFQQAIYGTDKLDYAVADIGSVPQNWWKIAGDDCSKGCTDTVTVTRKGAFIWPVTVEARFSDGSSERRTWDGKDRWTRLSFTKNARIVSATVDPDHHMYLDADYFNNSMTADSHGGAAAKLSNYWLFANQLLGQLFAWFV